MTDLFDARFRWIIRRHMLQLREEAQPEPEWVDKKFDDLYGVIAQMTREKVQELGNSLDAGAVEVAARRAVEAVRAGMVQSLLQIRRP